MNEFPKPEENLTEEFRTLGQNLLEHLASRLGPS